MINLDAATVLLQWSAGGMLFCWFTTRRREVGLGYGWMLRLTYLTLALGALWAGLAGETVWLREIATIGFLVSTASALVVSVVRRRVGVRGRHAEHDRRTARVAAMTGIDRTVDVADGDGGDGGSAASGPEFPPLLDLVPVLIAAVGLVGGALDAGGNGAVAVLRTLVGAAFLGAITDAMLLGHWYLVQPGLPRRHLNDLVRVVMYVLPAEVVVLLLPVGMIAVLTGEVDDGWGGTLGWFWVACVVATFGLCLVTRAALKERYYSAVMSATGLLYLAILTSFGTDLVARAVLA